MSITQFYTEITGINNLLGATIALTCHVELASIVLVLLNLLFLKAAKWAEDYDNVEITAPLQAFWLWVFILPRIPVELPRSFMRSVKNSRN